MTKSVCKCNGFNLILASFSILTLVLGVTIKRVAGAKESEVFIVTERQCITNSSSALSFITPVENTDARAKHNSDFLSSSSQNLNIDCKIEKDDNCNSLWTVDQWTLQESIQSNINHVITDWRWEEFELHRTHNVDYQGGSLKFEKVLNFNKGNFEIPVSIRIKQDAHIFLCDGKVTKSTCYWFMLQASSGTKSFLRKCGPGPGGISIKYGVWPKSPCKDYLVEIEHNENTKILYENFWSHFKIKKEDNVIIVTRNEEEVLKYDDPIPFSPDTMFFHSKVVNGLWKIHKYTYLYCTEKTTNQVGPPLQIRMGESCISMFIMMCSKCELYLRLVDNSSKENVYANTFSTKDEKWTEIKFLIESNESRNAKLYVTTKSEEIWGNFWAIDNVRECKQNEYRILQSPSDNLPCQMIEKENAFDIKNEIVSESTINCPETTFGTSCTPCELSESFDCTNFRKYCEQLNGRRMTCFCSPGYYSDINSYGCNIGCTYGTYGHGCKNRCGHCHGSCDKISGKCYSLGCEDQYTGDKCDIPPTGIFMYPPVVSSKDETSCTVFVSNFNMSGGSTPPLYYKIQYRVAAKESTWTDVGSAHNFHDNGEEVIRDLEPDIEYYVRAVTYSDRHNIATEGAIKYATCRTKCKALTPYNIDITPSNTSAKIDFKLAKDSCRIYNHVYSIGGSTKRNVEGEPLEIDALRPCNQYNLSLSYRYTGESVYKIFTTTEGVPTAVRALDAIKRSSTSIVLKWQRPENENCDIHYIIRYKLTQFKACTKGSINSEYETKEVYNLQEELNDLKPYSDYKILVSAVTKGREGKYAEITVDTEASDDLSEDEVLYVKQKDVSVDSVLVTLNKLDCMKIRGPIYLKVSLACQNEWCDQTNAVHNPKILTYCEASPSITEGTLFPYVNYTVTLQVSRYSTDWANAKTIIDHFTTKPSVPNKIKGVIVVSKDENSISLRWIPPYPPTGILKQYQIVYNTENFFKTWNYTEHIEVSPCKLWPSYHCATIKLGIKKGWTYHIQIWATNDSPRQFVQLTNMFKVTALTEAPGAPYDLSYNWTESNDLKITWKHPNATNGLLEKFQIIMNANYPKYFDINVDSEDDYNLTYSYQINGTNLEPCSKYTLSVKARNKAGEGTGVRIDDWTPPPLPPILANEKLETHSTNYTITLNLPRPKYGKETPSKNKLYMFISSAQDKEIKLKELLNFEDSVRKFQVTSITIHHSRLVLEGFQKYLPENFTIGSGNGTEFEAKNIPNPPLELGTEYSVNLFYVNECNGKVRLKWINKTAYTTGNPDLYVEKDPATGTESNKGLYALILLIFLIPLVGYAYIYIKKNKQTPSQAVTAFKQSPEKKTDEIPLTDKQTKVKVNPVKPLVKPALMPKPKENPQAAPLENSPPVLQTTHSKRIRLFEYASYVRESIQNGELERQHALFPRGQTKPWDYGALKINKSKNRYNNLIAYDHTRVKLRKIAGIDYSDYINANYIDGYKVSRAYIATQGPKAATVNDFWRMVWQHNVKNIVMLANVYESGKKKVEKYWPDINEERDFDGVRVQYVSSEVFANYEYRVFNVYNNSQHRRVEQLHFTSWPDHGVPLYSQCLVPFLQKMLKIPNSSQSPVVVHCSAGVGRTGTIILCDICLRMAAGEGSVDFLARLEHLRDQRANMVDNIEQYKLAHLVVLECLFGMHTSIACNDDMDQRVESLVSSGGIQKQMRYLESTEWQDKAMDTVWMPEEECPVYPEKNRIKDILPELHHRVFLVRYPSDDEQSSYINAVQVDGFRSPGRFVVTQQPMPNTVGDFWRLVAEKKSTVVISLNEINTDDKTSCRFWPENGEELNPVDYLKVCHADTRVLGCYRIATVHLINQKENENLSITIVSMSNWMPRDLLPNSVEEFLSFWEDSDAISRQSDPVIITCYDGATASGLYIATSFLIEKMKLEQECDVCLAVRTIRHNRRQFVTSEEQFEFLYRASVTYINGFQSYANFA